MTTTDRYWLDSDTETVQFKPLRLANGEPAVTVTVTNRWGRRKEILSQKTVSLEAGRLEYRRFLNAGFKSW